MSKLFLKNTNIGNKKDDEEEEDDFVTKALDMVEVNHLFLNQQKTSDLQQLTKHLLSLHIEDIQKMKKEEGILNEDDELELNFVL